MAPESAPGPCAFALCETGKGMDAARPILSISAKAQGKAGGMHGGLAGQQRPHHSFYRIW